MNKLDIQKVERLTLGNNLTKDILSAIDKVSSTYGLPVSSKDFNYGLDKYFYVDKRREIVDYDNEILDYQYTVHFETIDGSACYMIEIDNEKNPLVVDADDNASKYFEYESLTN